MAQDPLPQISLQQLDYLHTIANSPTWAEAASKLHVSPSALSQGIAELERRLGVSLFERQGRRRLPAANAMEVFRYAERVIAQSHDLNRWLSDHTSGRTGRVRVGMIDVAAVQYFPDVLRTFRSEQPGASLTLTVAPTTRLVEQMRAGDLDLAVGVLTDGALTGMTLEPLLSEAMCLYAPHGRRLGPPANWGPWVSFPEGSRTRSLVAAALAEEGAPFDVVAESHQPDVLREMVHLEVGWTVLPEAQAESGMNPLPRSRRKPLLRRTLALIRPMERVANPAADLLGGMLLSQR